MKMFLKYFHKVLAFFKKPLYPITIRSEEHAHLNKFCILFLLSIASEKPTHIHEHLDFFLRHF